MIIAHFEVKVKGLRVNTYKKCCFYAQRVILNSVNYKKLQDYILVHAPSIQHRLPPCDRHPNGRNAYAHLWIVLKDAYGVDKVKDIPDNELNTCFEILKIAVEYAHELGISRRFPKVKRVCSSNTLEDFFV